MHTNEMPYAHMSEEEKAKSAAANLEQARSMVAFLAARLTARDKQIHGLRAVIEHARDQMLLISESKDVEYAFEHPEDVVLVPVAADYADGWCPRQYETLDHAWHDRRRRTLLNWMAGILTGAEVHRVSDL